jgi:hypothetical protein
MRVCLNLSAFGLFSPVHLIFNSVVKAAQGEKLLYAFFEYLTFFFLTCTIFKEHSLTGVYVYRGQSLGMF